MKKHLKKNYLIFIRQHMTLHVLELAHGKKGGEYITSTSK
jgi:hypothetical protein